MKFFKDFSIRKLLYNKKFAIIISIVAAFAFWLVIVIDQNPEREQTFNSIPIEVSTAGTIWGEQGLEVVNEITQTASVTVFGPNYIVSSLKADDIKINADLSAVNGSGTYTINLSAVRNSNQSGYSFVSIAPASVTVQFDYYDEKSFAVNPVVEGYGRVEGLTYDDEVVANSEEANIIVRGPRSDVSQIASVVAYASTNKQLDTTATFDGEIKLLDVNGKELDKSNYEISAESIKISVPVSKTKLVRFSPSYTNIWNNSIINTLNNYWKADIETFTIAGPPEVIDNLETIEFTPIDLTKISPKNKANVFEVSPILPNGVRITDGIETVTVTYNLSDFDVKRIKISKFDDENTLPKGMTVSYSSYIYVEVCGKKSVLDSLSSSDYYLSVDLTGAAVGESLVNATVKTYNNNEIWQVVPCEISVKLK